MSSEAWGRGMSYPLRLGRTGISESVGTAKIEESIRSILGTQYGERVMRPRFGSNLKTLVFAPNNSATANLARFYTEEALSRWEPRIEVDAVTVTNDNTAARLVIAITYRLRGRIEPATMTYPLSLQDTP